MDNILSIERFNDALQRKGWTMKRLAAEYDMFYPNESGKSIYNTLRKWNTGKGNPTLEKLVRVCDLLECDIDYLIGRMDNHTHTTKFICDQTGLAESTIEMLIDIYRFECPDKLRALDYLFTNTDFYYALLFEFYTYYNCALHYYDEKEKDRDFDYTKLMCNRALEDAETRLERMEYMATKTFYKIIDAIKNAAESNSVPVLDRKNLYDDDDDDL